MKNHSWIFDLPPFFPFVQSGEDEGVTQAAP